MADSAIAEFDFDAWTELHDNDPAAFEAQRQTVLMMALARGDTQAQRDAGRAALARYEHAATGLTGEARMQLSATMMAESMTSLTLQLQSLSATLGDVAANIASSEQASEHASEQTLNES